VKSPMSNVPIFRRKILMSDSDTDTDVNSCEGCIIFVHCECVCVCFVLFSIGVITLCHVSARVF